MNDIPTAGDQNRGKVGQAVANVARKAARINYDVHCVHVKYSNFVAKYTCRVLLAFNCRRCWYGSEQIEIMAAAKSCGCGVKARIPIGALQPCSANMFSVWLTLQYFKPKSLLLMRAH